MAIALPGVSSLEKSPAQTGMATNDPAERPAAIAFTDRSRQFESFADEKGVSQENPSPVSVIIEKNRLTFDFAYTEMMRQKNPP